ncbi:ArpU family phage packaging/lysis transcriptional regulator [Bacillus suaedae]|uniref:Transcriptional regulator n=1 Tax=Halalkalibacter suaedae TaxID=2822140 RepID=A0A940X178_9BACI|nr:transcriptional regulator [Bacillus suaedae]
MSFELPELDRRQTQAAVEKALSKYRISKYVAFDDREATTTASYQERLHGPTNTTSDQTAQVAIENVDQRRKQKEYCERIERAVKRLPPMERFLIEQRYLADDAEYITDYNVYSFKFQPPISEGKYRIIRWKAFYKLSLNLNLAINKE